MWFTSLPTMRGNVSRNGRPTKTYEEAKKRRTEVEYREQIGKLVMPKCVTMEDLVREFIANYGKKQMGIIDL